MSAGGHRLLHFAGSVVTVDWTGGDPARIAGFLFGDFPAPPPGSPPPVARYHLGGAPEPPGLLLTRDGVDVWSGEDPGAAAEAWLGAVSHELAWHGSGGLLFHAGALAGGAGGVILPGGIGAGKTTLALWLAVRGLGCCTDEMVFVPDGSADAVCCPRPLNLKAGTLEALDGRLAFLADPGFALPNPRGCLLARSALGSPGPQRLSWDRVVFPRFEAGADLTLERLSPARAGLELMGALVNARNLPDHGFGQTTRLARRAPAWLLRYGSLDQLGPLEDLLLAG